MINRGLTLVAVLAGFLAWVAIRRPKWVPQPVLGFSVEARRNLEQGTIRWSGEFLHSMGAVESGHRAQQEALLAHKVANAVMERLQAAITDLRVMIIGGVIHLEGYVGSAEARTEAERVAREISGARVIADDLKVL